jgi:hypothetical protein
VRRNAALALAAFAGAAVGAALARRRATIAPSETADPRADELRRKLSEARLAPVDEDEFEAAGMGAETIIADEPPAPASAPPAPAEREHEPGSEPERSPGEEFEAMRRRIHEEGRAAAEEMRRGAE